MKRNYKFVSALTAFLTCLTMTAVSASALSPDELAFFTDYHLNTDAFSYTSDRNGITLKSELLETKPNFMVCSVKRDADGHVLDIQYTTINQGLNGERSSFVYMTEERSLAGVLEGCDVDDLQIGDLLKVNVTGSYDSVPGQYWTDHIQWLGHGTDLLGEEFLYVMRHEQINEPIVGYNDDATIPEGITYDTVPVIAGDADEDADLSIMDVILVNRHIMGSAHFLPCQKLAADVDKSNKLDTTDSLMILKEVVEITEGFVEN